MCSGLSGLTHSRHRPVLLIWLDCVSAFHAAALSKTLSLALPITARLAGGKAEGSGVGYCENRIKEALLLQPRYLVGSAFLGCGFFVIDHSLFGWR